MKINEAINLFLKYCKSIRLADGTIKNYKQSLSIFTEFLTNIIEVGDCDVNEITAQTIKAYFIELQQKYAINTVKQYHAILSTFYRWLSEDMEIVETNLASSAKPRFKHESKKQPVVTREEMAEILKVFDGVPLRRRTMKYYRNKFLLQTLYGCGLRINELLNLKHSDFNERDSSFSLIAKGDREHKVYLTNPDAIETYMKLKELQKRKFDSDWILTDYKGDRLSLPGFRNIVDTCAKDAGIEKHITPHSFRRGCATALIENGVDVSVVKDVLGHANIATTMRYVQLSEKAVKDTMIIHCPLNNL